MRRMARITASAALGGLVLLSLPSPAAAQTAPRVQAITHVASLAPGSILGTVQDEKGAPVAGATVSAFGIIDRGAIAILVFPGPVSVRLAAVPPGWDAPVATTEATRS